MGFLSQLWRMPSETKTLTSRFYGALSNSHNECTAHVRSLWEADFGEAFPDNEWESVWSSSTGCLFTSKSREMQFRVIHRLLFFHIWDPFLDYIGDDGAQALWSDLCGLAWTEVLKYIPRS